MIGWDELRFTLEELGEMLCLGGYGERPPEVVAQIHKKTEGWAAGIVLLLEGARNGGIESVLSRVHTSKEILQYFAGEVFHKAEPELQDFLIKTSFLPRMSWRMAEALTGNRFARSILDELNERNFFTQRFDSKTVFYRYHALFREFLQYRAREVFDEAALAASGKKAAFLLEENGQPEEAFELFKKLAAWPEAVELILKHAPSFVARGLLQTLGEMISALPESVADANPWLLYWKAVCILASCPPLSRDRFKKAFDLFREKKDATGTFLSLSGLFDSIIYTPGRQDAFDEELALLDQVMGEEAQFPSVEIEAKLVANKLFAIVWRDLARQDLAKTVERSLLLLPRVDDYNVKMQLFQGLCFQSIILGEFQTARSLIVSAGGRILNRDASPLVRIVFKVTECIFRETQAEFQKTAEIVKEALDTASATGMYLVSDLLLGHGATAALYLGDLNTADLFLQEMEKYLDRLSSHAQSYYYQLNWWKLFLKEEFSNSLIYAELALKACLEAGAPWATALVRLGCALSLHELKRHAEAQTCFAQALAFATSVHSPLYEFTCFLTEAKFAFDKGDESAGLMSLEKGLSIGARNGYMNTPFFWIPSIMAELCRKALQAGIEIEYVRGLIRKRNLMPATAPGDCEQWPWALKIHTLGRFEIARDDDLVPLSGMLQKKPLETLKLLISSGEGELSGEYIADCLWPDLSGDNAHNALKMTVSRMRRQMGVEDAIRFQDGKVSLDAGRCWIDAKAFERIAAQFEKWVEGNNHGDYSEGVALAQKAIALYRGRFLAEDEEKFWTISYRQRLRHRFSRLIARLGELLEKSGQWEKASEFYQKGIEIDELAEEFYQRLMICHREVGRRVNAIETYKCCSKLLSSKLGIGPSPVTEAIYRSL